MANKFRVKVDFEESTSKIFTSREALLAHIEGQMAEGDFPIDIYDCDIDGEELPKAVHYGIRWEAHLEQV